MKRLTSNILYPLLLAVILINFSCNDDLDIKQDYDYSIETLPLPSELACGDSIPLEFSIVRDGYYTGAVYKFRYFQSEGEGSLIDAKGQTIPVNRFQPIPSDDFVLHYKCNCEEQQQLDFVFEDNFGLQVEYSIEFASE